MKQYGEIEVPTADKVVGENIGARRRAMGFSRKALAEALGQDESWLRRIEEGQSLPAYMLPAINKALGLTEPFILLKANVFQ
jgi:transcriptional regulator with XRE-family HTH domain